VCTST